MWAQLESAIICVLVHGPHFTLHCRPAAACLLAAACAGGGGLPSKGQNPLPKSQLPGAQFNAD